MNAEIIAIGSELLTPSRVDTNSLYLTEQLNSIGIEVELKTVVGDNEHRLEQLLKEAVKRSELVIATGGLGPTEDDVTKKVVSRVIKKQLVLEQRILERIQARFRNRGWRCRPTMPDRLSFSTDLRFWKTLLEPLPDSGSNMKVVTSCYCQALLVN